MSGVSLRLRRFFRASTNRTVIFPLDHGVTCGPVAGLEDITKCLKWGIEGGADAFVLHKGMLNVAAQIKNMPQGIFMHLSGSTQLGASINRKVIVGGVEEAIKRGADGVSCHINLANEYESEMLEALGRIGDECYKWQIPLLVMVYIRGSYADSVNKDEAIVHGVRLATELGASIVKTSRPTSVEFIRKLVEVSHVPVVLAGGTKAKNEMAFLNGVQEAIECGISGVAIGRNVFQHSDPVNFLKAIVSIVHGDETAEEAWNMLKNQQKRKKLL